MNYFNVSDDYCYNNIPADRFAPEDWQMNFSCFRNLTNGVVHIQKIFFSTSVRNYYKFDFLLYNDTIFASTVYNNCKRFTIYNKRIYKEFIKSYSKDFNIKKLKYKRNFSFFNNYAFGPLYSLYGQYNEMFRDLMESVENENKMKLFRYLNSIEPELKAAGIQGFYYLEKYYNYELSEKELTIIADAENTLDYIQTAYKSSFESKGNLLNSKNLDRIYIEYEKNKAQQLTPYKFNAAN